MKRWPYLTLDDIGAEREPNGFAAEKLTTLLGCRTRQWTLLTVNLNLTQVECIDIRIPSRMRRDGSQIVEVTTMDYALREVEDSLARLNSGATEATSTALRLLRLHPYALHIPRNTPIGDSTPNPTPTPRMPRQRADPL